MKLAIILCALSAFVFSVYWYVTTTGETGSDYTQPVSEAGNSASTDSIADTTASPFSVDDAQDSSATVPTELLDRALNTPPAPPSDALLPQPSSMLWSSSLNDEQLRALTENLKADSQSLQQFIDDFRQETDLELKKLRADVLGDVGGEQALLVASELIFSGDSASRTLGMNLLQEIQPGNAAARDIVSGMLSTEVDPPVLIDALTALASPGAVDTQSRAYLADQVALLTSHGSGDVRSISLDILSRWSDDGRHTDILLAGLDDTSEYVRTSAAYALAGHEEKSPLVIARLMRTLSDEQELKSVKNAAILALRAMPLSTEQANEVDRLERQLNVVP